MLLLSSTQRERQRRASLLLLAAVLLCVVSTTASLPASRRCPPYIDCAKEGRHLCKPGSSHCGPCLSALEENEEGRCVKRKKHHQHVQMTLYPDPDEEIDYLHSYIEKQQVTEIKTPQKHSKHPVAVLSPTNNKNSKTGATNHKEKEQQDHPPAETQNATTAAPHPAASALLTPHPRATGAEGQVGPAVAPSSKNDSIIIIVISLCVVVGGIAVILSTVCFVKLQKESRLAQKVDYPAFRGPGGPAAAVNNTSMGDKTLAQSAQMYHYQHQKQQMLSMGTHKPEQKAVDTEVTSDEEEVGGDFTVYECPGLAPTGEMEVKNPLFDDSTLHYQGNQK